VTPVPGVRSIGADNELAVTAARRVPFIAVFHSNGAALGIAHPASRDFGAAHISDIATELG
jgi:hypothetical protein